MNKILHGDSAEELKKLADNSVDLVCTDPPYGYSFMGKNWDKAVPSVEIWKECLRVLKPGGFAFVMSAPRQDVLSQMIVRIAEAGFDTDFTSIYWTYASGFPKAMNMGKMVDKRGGEYLESVTFSAYIKEKRVAKSLTLKDLNKHFGYVAGCNWWEAKGSNFRVPSNFDYKKLKNILDLDDRYDHLVGAIGEKIGEKTRGTAGFSSEAVPRPWKEKIGEQVDVHAPATSQARALDGSYGGFQPKPAVEVIIVAMKPLSEKTFVDQALKNGKGITWLDDCRMPTTDSPKGSGNNLGYHGGGAGTDGNVTPLTGRFPANLLVSDDVLNDGLLRKTGAVSRQTENGDHTQYAYTKGTTKVRPADSGSYSRYFDLDSWAKTLPFLIVPKASKREKNEGLEDFERVTVGDGRPVAIDNAFQRGKTERVNSHPTTKPLKLMSYLITLGSRPGDVVLDPFLGSGTTALAAKHLDRRYIGIEREVEYVEIAKARLKEVQPTLL